MRSGINITGNGNIIGDGSFSLVIKSQHFTGEHERLRDAYIDPWPVFERVELDHFVGREWLLAEVDAFLRDHDRGYFTIEADAGLGKTTFLAWLVRQRGYIHHFCEMTPGIDGLGQALKNLAAQLALTHHLNAYEAEGVLPGAATRPDYLLRLLRLAAEQRREDEKIVLVIDALDEAGTPLGQNVLGLPQVLPEGVYLIVSQRPVSVTLHMETSTTPRCVFQLAASSNENQADMRRFLEYAAAWPGVAQTLKESDQRPEQFVRALIDKCQGVWVYLHYIVHEIERGERSPLDLDALPNGMTQYYARYWQRWRAPHETQWYEIYLPLLAALAAAREAVPAQWLVEWTGVQIKPGPLCRLLDESWRPFLSVDTPPSGPVRARQAREQEPTTYRLYHASLREFLNGDIDTTGLTESERYLVGEITEATQEAQAQIAAYYLVSPTRWHEHSRYALRHLCAHLVTSREEKALYDLVVSREWWNAKRHYDRSSYSNLQDVEMALGVVDATIEKSTQGCTVEPTSPRIKNALACLPSLFALTLAGGTVRGAGNNAPVEAIAGLAELGDVEMALNYAAFAMDIGAWTGARLFAAHFLRGAENVLEHSKQAEAYRRIALACLEQVESNGLDRSTGLGQERINEASFALASAVHILEGMHEQPDLQLLLPAMARAGMHGDVERVAKEFGLDLSWEEQPSGGKTDGFAINVGIPKEPITSEENRVARLWTLGREIEDAATQADAEKAAADLVATVRALGTAGHWGYDLAEELSLAASQLAGTRSTSLALEFIAAVKGLTYEYADQDGRTLAGVVESLSSVLSENQIRDLLEEAWQTVSANDRKDFRAAGRARVVVAMHRVGLQGRAKTLLALSIDATSDIWPLRDREFALEALARAATKNRDRENLDLVLSVADEMEGRESRESESDRFKRRIIRSFAETGAFQTAWEILDQAWTELEQRNSCFQATIVDIVSEMEWTDSATEALKVVEKISSAESKLQALCNLAVVMFKSARLSDATALLQRAIYDCLIPTMRGSEMWIPSQVETLAKAAMKIRSMEVLEQIGQLSKQLRDSEHRDRALAMLVPCLLDVEAEPLYIAPELAHGIRNPGQKALALAAVAGHAYRSTRSKQAEKLIDEATRLVGQVARPKEQAETYLAVAIAVVECGQLSKADGLLVHALDIASSWPRDRESSFLWKERGASTPEISPGSHAEFLGACFDVLGKVGPGVALSKALSIVQNETEAYRKAYLTAKMICALDAMGRDAAAPELLTTACRQLRTAVPDQRALADAEGFRWLLADDLDYVVEIAESMALLCDADGLLSLVSQVRYLQDPEWQRDWGVGELQWAQAHGLSSIVGHLVELGKIDEAHELVAGMQTDQERGEAVAEIVRILWSLKQRTPIEWIRTVTDGIQEPVCREFAQRRLAGLMAQCDLETEAWIAAKHAIDSAALVLSGWREGGLFNCLQDTCDYVRVLVRYGSTQTVELIHHALQAARTLGRYDVWAFVAALYPLLAGVAGSEVAYETWELLQRVESLRTVRSAVPTGMS